MNLELEIEFSKAPIFAELDALKKQIDDQRPLPADVAGRVMQKLRLEWNYNSNAIEGNKLTYGETTALLMHGITAKGKPLKDHLDIKGHNKAVEYLEQIVQDGRDFIQVDIRDLHEIILGEAYNSPALTAEGLQTTKLIEVGKYKSSPNHVKTVTGEIHYYATPEETPAKMDELMEWYDDVKRLNIHPVVIASLFHHRFVAIHPFDDGNGRVARILMNLILMRAGYPPVVVKKSDRENYYSLLSQADSGDYYPFVEYISELTHNSLQLYIKAINGGDVEEDEDIDKEIALLKVQLNGGMIVKDKKTTKSIERVFTKSILPLAIKLDEKSYSFREYFFSGQNWLRYRYVENNKPEHGLEWIGLEYKPKYLELIGDKKKDIEEFSIELGYREYRNPENNFNLIVKANILFETYYYKIIVNGELIISKLYHEDLSNEDSNKIIKAMILNFKNQFDEKNKKD